MARRIAHFAGMGVVKLSENRSSRSMSMLPVTKQVESRRPLSRTSKDACLIHIYPMDSVTCVRHVLGTRPFVLGRGEDCEITINDHSVSRRQVRFDLEVDGYLVTDLGSTNGTFVNDTPANGTPLKDGDYLRVGNCLFRFLAGGNVEGDYHEELVQASDPRRSNRPAQQEIVDRLSRSRTGSIRSIRPAAGPDHDRHRPLQEDQR